MASSISNMVNSRLRFSGMSSGLDVDSIVQQLMKNESTKVDKVKQERQVLQWKQESYRSITSILKGFQSEYFDVLNASKNMRSSSSMSAYKTTYGGADTSSFFSAVAGSSVISGNYSVSNISIAKAAKAVGDKAVTGTVKGSAAITVPISAAADNNKINITFNGVQKEITIADTSGAANIKTALQNSIDAAFGKDASNVSKIVVEEAGGILTFSTSSTNTMKIDNAYNTGLTTILGSKISSPVELTSQNNKFKVALGTGEPKEIEIAAGTYTANQLSEALQAELDSKFGADTVRVLNFNDTLSLKAVGAGAVTSGALAAAGAINSDTITVDSSNKDITINIDGVEKTISLAEKDYTKSELLNAIQTKLNSDFGSNKAMVSLDGDSLKFEGVSTDALTTSKKENGGLSALGLTGANKSNKADLTSNINSIQGNFSVALTDLVTDKEDTTTKDISFSINGKTFEFNSMTTSINDIISAVNADTTANVKMKYDEMNNSMVIESKTMGATAAVDVDDINGGFMTALGLHGADKKGIDAKMTLKDTAGTVHEIERSSNDFTFGGISFSLKQDSTDSITMNIAGDPSKTFDLVKSFITKYNEVIDNINGKVSESRPKSGSGSNWSYYLPLTDDQKEAMKDSEVELWQEKAKTGLLYRDRILQGITDGMRAAFSDKAAELASIGITTGSYSQKGKLIIDEEKLKNAITENPDFVTELFTGQSSTAYSPDLSYADRQKRFKENGISNRLYDVIQDNIRTSRDFNGKKGILLEKAGVAGDITDINNLINEDIEKKDDLIYTLTERLATKQDMYYAKFTALETALARMNSQSSWLSQQTGS